MGQLPEPLRKKKTEQFDRVTQSIESALSTLQGSPDRKATAAVLADLAGVSRRTLYNRKWPIQHLKIIKEDRNSELEASTSSENESETKSCEEVVETLQQENAVLFHKLEDQRRKNAELQRKNDKLMEIIKRTRNNISLNGHYHVPSGSSLDKTRNE